MQKYCSEGLLLVYLLELEVSATQSDDTIYLDDEPDQILEAQKPLKG